MNRKKSLFITGFVIVILSIFTLLVVNQNYTGNKAYDIAISKYGATPDQADVIRQKSDPMNALENTPKPDKHNMFQNNNDIKGSTLIMFYLPGCPYCEASYEALTNAVTAYEKEHPEHADKIGYVNISTDFGQELASKYNIQSAQTLLVLDQDKNGKIFDRATESNNTIYPNKQGISDALNHFNEVVGE